jgi:hypothetical protein
MAYKREHVKERFRPKPGRLLDQVRDVMRYHHYAIRTEQTYVRIISALMGPDTLGKWVNRRSNGF